MRVILTTYVRPGSPSSKHCSDPSFPLCEVNVTKPRGGEIPGTFSGFNEATNAAAKGGTNGSIFFLPHRDPDFYGKCR